MADDDLPEAAGESSLDTQGGGRPPARGIHYLAKSVLKGSAVLHAVQGHFRSSSSLEVVLGKETSIELVVVSDDGIVQSICEQTVFGMIKDLAVLSWNEKLSARLPKGRDLLVVLSDSGKISLLAFITELDRFLGVFHLHFSMPGENRRDEIGRMLAVDSNTCFLAVSAYEDKFAVLSLSTSKSGYTMEKRIFYPPQEKKETNSRTCPPETIVEGTIWSMCFISKGSHQLKANHCNPILAIVMHRKTTVYNDLLLFEYNTSDDTIHIRSQYSEAGPLALNITEVPHMPGFAILFRIGDALLMDLRDPYRPCCIYRADLNFSGTIEDSICGSCRGLDADDVGIYAHALLELKDSGSQMITAYDPMSIDSGFNDSRQHSKFVCAWSWEPRSSESRLIICLDTGELCILDIHGELEPDRITIHSSLYKGLPCKVLLWVKGGLIAAFVEMGDGVVLKLENGMLYERSPIQNIAPILDMSFVYCDDVKQHQMFACCGVGIEGSLRIIRSGISVEKLLRTAPIYQGITGTWTLKMKEIDPYHAFLVLSFVEETRVLSVGLSFVDVTDAVGFLANASTLACGLLADGLLVQIHKYEVRLCLPTLSAHHDGIPLSLPICTSWCPDKTSISVGAVGRNIIVVGTSNPCLLFVLGIKSLPAHQYEIFEVQHVRLYREISCISIPCKNSKKQNLSFLDDQNPVSALPDGVEIGKTIVIGTHRPSVEILSFVSGGGIRIIAVGTITINNTLGEPISGCIPEDVRLVLVDRCYIITGLRNGLLLRFEWSPNTLPKESEFGIEEQFSRNHYTEMDTSLHCATSTSVGLPLPDHRKAESFIPVLLQLIAIRRIGVTPVSLVPLEDSLHSEIIALSDRPWLLHTARHSLAYTAISFQSATHVTPVSSADCPEGILFVSENILHLVEMVQSKRLNVQKFRLCGTPRKVLYHSESKTFLVMRIGLTNDSCSSDICRVDAVSGSLLSKFKLEPGETGKCMEIMILGNELFLVVGTSQTPGNAIMPSGEAKSSKGRLVFISLENAQNSDGSSLIFCPDPHSSSHANSPFREIVGHTTEQLSSSSLCSSPEDNHCGGMKHEESEAGQLKFINAKAFFGVVLSVCPYLDDYLLVSAGNILYVFGFLNDNPSRLRKLTSVRTRFTITSLTTHSITIAAGDCRDGILFYTYQEDQRKLELLYVDPVQRLTADCILMDMNTAFASDKRGSISILSSRNDLEDSASPEHNLSLSCSYYLGETAMTIQKGSFNYMLPTDNKFNGFDDATITDSIYYNNIVAGTLLGSVVIFIPIRSEVYNLLKVVETQLASYPLTAPLLGNLHDEFRARGSPAGVQTMLDGDLLAQFLELTSVQQEKVMAYVDPADSDAPSSSSKGDISISQVVQLLERVHYALS